MEKDSSARRRLWSFIFVLVFITIRTDAAQSITLAWDANTENDLAGYIVYYGPAAGFYTNATNVGNVTTNRVNGLTEGSRYFFVVTAYNTSGMESDPSNEISYTAPAATNSPPSIGTIANFATDEDITTPPVSFIVRDNETAASNLIVTAAASNPALVANSNIVLSGTGTNRTIVLAPRPNQFGTTTVTLTVSDGATNASTSFVLTVNPVNDPPFISAVSNLTIDEDTSSPPIAFEIRDPETPPDNLQLSAISSDSTLLPGTNIIFAGMGTNRTMTLTPAPNHFGVATVTISVSDAAAASSITFNVTVNPVNGTPVISAVTNQTIDEDTSSGPILFQVKDAETTADNLQVTAMSSDPILLPETNIIFAGTGTNRTVSLTPAANQYGVATVTLSVSDGASIANKTFDVTVRPVNDAPVISVVPDQTLDEDTSSGGMGFQVSDQETIASNLQVSAMSSNPVLLPDGNIIFSGSGTNRSVALTPAANQTGTANVAVVVSDGNLSSSTTFSVVVNDVNDAPSISSIADKTISRNTSSGPLPFVVQDLETAAANLVVSAVSSNPTLVPNTNLVLSGSSTNRTITVTPGTNQSGTATIAITVSDGSTNATTAFTVTVPDAVSVSMEAEAATLVSPMVVFTNSQASNARYIATTQSERGSATFTMQVPVGGTYRIWSRLLATSGSRDSFYVSVDGGSEQVFTASKRSSSWQWMRVTGKNGTRTFSLLPGSHSVVFRGRERLTGLDKIIVSNDPNFVPTDNTASASTSLQRFQAFVPEQSLRIRSIHRVHGTVTLTWEAAPGTTYRVLYKNSLLEDKWVALDSFTAATDSAKWSGPVGTNSASRFYKIMRAP